MCLADYVLALNAEIQALKHKFQMLEEQLGDMLEPLPADAQPPARAASDAAGEAPACRPAPCLCSRLTQGASRRSRSAGTSLRVTTTPAALRVPPASPRSRLLLCSVGAVVAQQNAVACVLLSCTVVAGHARLLSRHERPPTSRQEP